MVFSSLTFLFAFLPIFLVLYYCSPAKYRNGLLFTGSLVFYGIGEPLYLCLIICSVLVNLGIGLFIDRSERLSGKRLWLITGLLYNFGSCIIIFLCWVAQPCYYIHTFLFSNYHVLSESSSNKAFWLHLENSESTFIVTIQNPAITSDGVRLRIHRRCGSRDIPCSVPGSCGLRHLRPCLLHNSSIRLHRHIHYMHKYHSLP